MEPRPGPSTVQSGADPAEASVVLITNGVSWYLRSRLAVDREKLTVITPRTILGLVPIGTRRFAVGLPDLETVAIGSKLNPDRLAVAAGFGLAAAFGGLGTVGTLLCSVGAVAFLLLAVIAVLRIESSNHPPAAVPVCLAHLRRARRFIADIELRSMAYRRSQGRRDP